jgi:hypothetical protein
LVVEREFVPFFTGEGEIAMKKEMHCHADHIGEHEGSLKRQAG